MDLWPVLADERRALAHLFASLVDAQWRTRTLCEAWDVQQMAAHLVVSTEFSTLEMVTAVARARGRIDRVAQIMVDRRRHLSREELVDRIRRQADSRTAPPVVGVLGPYTDALVHGEDVRIPLGLTDDGDPSRWGPALDFLTARRTPMGFLPGPAPRLRYEATDSDWASGDGDVVRAPASALALAVMRRRPRLDELGGPGAGAMRAWATA